MNKKEELEILFSQTLKEKAEEIQLDEGLITNVKEKILLNKKGGGIAMRLKIMPLWKKAVAAVVIAALTMGIALGISPSVRAMASDALLKLGVITMKVVEEGKDFIVLKGTDDRGNEVGMEIRKIDSNDKNTPMEIGIEGQTQNFSSVEEAEKYLGMQIKLPSYLPEGYKLHAMIGDKGDKGVSKYFSATFINEQNNQLKTIWLRIEPSLSNISRNAEKVDINGTTGYWIEKEFIVFSSDENSSKKTSEKLETVKRYELYWQSDGLTYHLDGQDLTKEEAVKIAESIR